MLNVVALSILHFKHINQNNYSHSVTLKAPTQQNGQTHLNDSLATADELFECVWPFCGVGTKTVGNLDTTTPLVEILINLSINLKTFSAEISKVI